MNKSGLIIGFSGGIIFALLIVYYVVDYSDSEYIQAVIDEQKHIATDAFEHYSGNISDYAQINYLIFLKRTYEAGLIGNDEYQKLSAIANIRLCINYEDAGDVDNAKKFCKWAEDHLSHSKEIMTFEEFKQKQRKMRKSKLKGTPISRLRSTGRANLCNWGQVRINNVIGVRYEYM